MKALFKSKFLKCVCMRHESLVITPARPLGPGRSQKNGLCRRRHKSAKLCNQVTLS